MPDSFSGTTQNGSPRIDICSKVLALDSYEPHLRKATLIYAPTLNPSTTWREAPSPGLNTWKHPQTDLVKFSCLPPFSSCNLCVLQLHHHRPDCNVQGAVLLVLLGNARFLGVCSKKATLALFFMRLFPGFANQLFEFHSILYLPQQQFPQRSSI
jgi:hypothetical protein